MEELKKSSEKRIFQLTKVNCLQKNLKAHKDVLESKLTNTVTNKLKNKLWSKITDKINAFWVRKTYRGGSEGEVEEHLQT